MKKLIYLVGEPGAGKSTLLGKALAQAGWDRLPQKKPLAFDLLHRNGLVEALELGVHRPNFPGTDALAMDAINAAERLLAAPPAPVVIGEGARLANLRFLQTAQRLGYAVTLVHVVSPDAEVNRRRRAMKMGAAEQKDGWVRAQQTKVKNLIAAVPDGVQVVEIDTSTPDAVAALHAVFPPVLRPRVRKAAA